MSQSSVTQSDNEKAVALNQSDNEKAVELALAFKQSVQFCTQNTIENNNNDNKMTNVTFQEEKKIVVVGTGDKGHGLAKSYVLHSKKNGHYKFVLTEPMPSKIIDPFNSDFITIEHFPECPHKLHTAQTRVYPCRCN